MMHTDCCDIKGCFGSFMPCQLPGNFVENIDNFHCWCQIKVWRENGPAVYGLVGMIMIESRCMWSTF